MKPNDSVVPNNGKNSYINPKMAKGSPVQSRRENDWPLPRSIQVVSQQLAAQRHTDWLVELGVALDRVD